MVTAVHSSGCKYIGLLARRRLCEANGGRRRIDALMGADVIIGRLVERFL